MQLRRVLTLATIACAAACAQRSATNAPPAGAAPGTTQPGKFVWHDLVTEDLAGSQRFYGSLLGWQFQETTRLGKKYVVATLDGRRVAGLVPIEKKGDEKTSQWLGYVSVGDVDRAVEAVGKAGGRTLVAPVQAPAGRAAVVIDPQGAPLGLVRLAQGDPPDEASPQENRFFWMEYLAGDTAAALTFYTGLLGYQAETETVGDKPYQILRQGRPRAGLLQAPPEGVKPTWLCYVLVKDPAALAARVEALGGKVLLAPDPSRRKGTFAVVADPSGAALALQKWPI